MKQILIINGSGGVGKDTFVDILGSMISTMHISIIDPIKDFTRNSMWNGDKSEKSRKFLCDMKTLTDEYCDFSYKYIEHQVKLFLKNKYESELLCIDMREPKDINRIKKDYNVYTVFVKRDSVKQITTNEADKHVNDIKYDYYIDNSGTIEDLKKETANFLSNLLIDYLVKESKDIDISKTEINKNLFFDKTNPKREIFYVSHPFEAKKDNLKEVSDMILRLKKLALRIGINATFFSPINCFDFLYNEISYDEGIDDCLALLKQCDKMIVFGDYWKSRGCKIEIDFCKKNNIPIVFLDNKKLNIDIKL